MEREYKPFKIRRIFDAVNSQEIEGIRKTSDYSRQIARRNAYAYKSNFHKKIYSIETDWETSENGEIEWVIEIGKFPIEFLTGINWNIITNHSNMSELYTRQVEIVQIEDSDDEDIKNIRLVYGVRGSDKDDNPSYDFQAKLVWNITNLKEHE